MLADETQRKLIIGRCRVFHPKQIIFFYFLAKGSGFARQQTMMHIMQQF